jgi:hypothetical protein
MEPHEALADWLRWMRDGGRTPGDPEGSGIAWERALARVVKYMPPEEAKEVRAFFSEQREFWERMYQRRPRSVPKVAERRCGHCSASLEGRRPNVTYCDADCRRKGKWAREREQKAAAAQPPTAGF